MGLGGKRLRPMLVLLAHRLFCDDGHESVLDPAIAVEVFHNFTLMHDDIMDQAPLRRGRPTVHEEWDSPTAILSGDVMLVRAYELMAKVPDDKLRAVLVAFSKTAAEVCEGQQIDMNFERSDEVTEAGYIQMISLKTAVLLGFSLQLGGMLGGATEQQQDDLYNCGLQAGIGFQLMDDLLDVYGDKAKFGKQVGGDILSDKKTFLLIEALARTSGEDREALLSWIGDKDREAEEKVEAITAIYDRNGIREATEKMIAACFDDSLEYLAALDLPSERKEPLQEFLNRLLARNH